MRLGEKKNIFASVLNDNQQIEIESEAIYGGQAYKISNFNNLMKALEILAEQIWNSTDYGPIEGLASDYSFDAHSVEMKKEDFDKITAYISAINPQVPIFFGVLDSIVDPQEEQVINIKLPTKINSIKALQTFNGRLENIFKRFNLKGEFQFLGFDRGTNWYEILITTELLYKFFLACLSVAYGVLVLKKTFYEGENARLAYKAHSKKESDKTKEEFLDTVAEEKIEEGVQTAMNEINDRNGKTEEELKVQLINATKELLKELDTGTEFHLSLNPPQYAREGESGLSIDYKSMPRAQIDEPERKQIESLEEAGTSGDSNLDENEEK